MKVLHVMFTVYGGAGIAARRIHEAVKGSGISSELAYFKPYSRRHSGISWLAKKWNGAQNIVLQRFINSDSLNVVPTRMLDKINESDADVVNLHWINAELISIEQVGQIRKPVVWSCHDMWPFCGAEHYSTESRYRTGYTPDNFRPGEGHVSRLLRRRDVNRWVFLRKQKAWRELRFHIVCASEWLAECARGSVLFRDLPVSAIPYSVDLDVFRPRPEKTELRARYGLPPDKRVVVFGAVDPTQMRKGGDLLARALSHVRDPASIVLAVFGASRGQLSRDVETHWMGSLHSEPDSAALYNTADVVAVPSRQEAFGQTASESLACGVPVVAFEATGLRDIVDHRMNGYLARPYDCRDFGHGLEWVLASQRQQNAADGAVSYAALCANAREKAARAFSPERVAAMYREVYERTLREAEERPSMQ